MKNTLLYLSQSLMKALDQYLELRSAPDTLKPDSGFNAEKAVLAALQEFGVSNVMKDAALSSIINDSIDTIEVCHLIGKQIEPGIADDAFASVLWRYMLPDPSTQNPTVADLIESVGSHVHALSQIEKPARSVLQFPSPFTSRG